MSYIGNPIVSTDFPVDYASGNGSTTAFTLSIAPASVNAVDVEVSGVSQSPQTYTISGTTLTFSAAPPSGTNNIVFKHRGIAGIPNTPSAGSVTPTSLSSGYSLWNLSGSAVNYTAGNVGIGTASPSSKLHLSVSSGTLQQQFNNGGTSSYIGLDSGFTGLDFAAGGGLRFRYFTGSVFAEGMRIDTSGNLLFNSGYGSAATAYGCRAWVNFNGTGTVAIRASGNVSSITDNGTADYTVNFTNAMPDVNYATTFSASNVNDTSGTNGTVLNTPTSYKGTTSQRFLCFNVYNGGANYGQDVAMVTMAFFR